MRVSVWDLELIIDVGGVLKSKYVGLETGGERQKVRKREIMGLRLLGN